MEFFVGGAQEKYGAMIHIAPMRPSNSSFYNWPDTEAHVQFVLG
jgi:hypothetical protein